MYTELPKDYHGLKILVNNNIRYMRPMKRRKAIEINTAFYAKLTDNQRKFMLEWCRKMRRLADVQKADEKTLTWYQVNVEKDASEIYALYKTMRFGSNDQKRQRMSNLIFSTPDTKWERKILLFFAPLTSLFKTKSAT